MAYETIQVTVIRDNTLTIEEFAKECKKKYGWDWVDVVNGDIHFTEAEDGSEEKVMYTNGDVHALDDEGDEGDLLEVKDLADDFDWTQHLWADDGEGNPILIFQH